MMGFLSASMWPEMSHTHRDKLSLPEMRSDLSDHVEITAEDYGDFHWLFPGVDKNNGLRRFANDKDCMHMVESITDSGVAEVYVELQKEDDEVVMLSGVNAIEVTKKPVIHNHSKEHTTRTLRSCMNKKNKVKKEE